MSDIYEISELLEENSIKYSNSFFLFLRQSIINSNTLQKNDFENKINDFFQNLDNLFKSEFEIRKVKNEEKIQNFIKEYHYNINHNILPEIEKIINNKIEFIENEKNKICVEVYTLIDEEIQEHEKRIKEAENDLKEKIKEKKNEIQGSLDNNRKLELQNELTKLEKKNILEFTYDKLLFRIRKIIEKGSNNINKEVVSMIIGIKEKIEQAKNFISHNKIINEISEKNQYILLLEKNLSFFYDIPSAITNSLIAIGSSLLRGAIVGITTSTIIGGTIGTSFGLPGIAIGAVIGLATGGIQLLYQYFQKDKKYEKALLKIRRKIIEIIKEKFDIIKSDLNEYNNDLKQELERKLEIEKNKFKPINYDEIREEYEKEKQEIKIQLEEIS